MIAVLACILSISLLIQGFIWPLVMHLRKILSLFKGIKYRIKNFNIKK